MVKETQRLGFAWSMEQHLVGSYHLHFGLHKGPDHAHLFRVAMFSFVKHNVQ